jgi:hypothetical protein
MAIGLLGAFILVSGVVGYLVGIYRIDRQSSPTPNHQVPAVKRRRN